MIVMTSTCLPATYQTVTRFSNLSVRLSEASGILTGGTFLSNSETLKYLSFCGKSVTFGGGQYDSTGGDWFQKRQTKAMAAKKLGFGSRQLRTFLKPGKVSDRLPVPPGILKPFYAETGEVKNTKELEIHDEEGIRRMREVGKLASEVREFAGTLVKPGVTTDEIDKAVHKKIIEAGAYPSPLNYKGFPKSVCTSVNECMAHGIPDSRPLEDGDIVNIDVTVYLNGYHGDTSKTFLCGKVSKEAKKLVEVNRLALNKAISICGPGVEFREIGNAIEGEVKGKGYKYGIVQRLVGHGVGKSFHAPPFVLHHKNDEKLKMVVGQTFTIEPILSLGSVDASLWEDKWTMVTVDASLAAQCEHTILITEGGREVLTA